MTPEEIIENAEDMRVEEMRMPEDPIERRIFRLEIYERNNTKDISELKDRTKNAHHRIDETQRDLTAFREETKQNFEKVDKKLDNIGVNMAKNAAKQKKFVITLIVIGILTIATFAGMFIQNEDTKRTVLEVASKATGVAVTAATAVL